MMEYQDQLKLQAYLDGELSEAEAREVANWLARDQGAASLLTELRQTRKALTGFEAGIRLPESREFFWSKVKRDIERQELPAPEAPARTPLLALLRRLLLPTTAVATAAIAAVLLLRPAPTATAIPGVELTSNDSAAFSYHDYSAGVTLVWFSGENNLVDQDEFGSVQ